MLAQQIRRFVQPSPQAVIIGVVGLLACILFFATDVVVDVFEHYFEDDAYEPEESVYLIFEALAVVVLTYCVLLLFGYVRFLNARAEESIETISLLRGQFQRILEERFDSWELTGAERDVAMLIVKGLSQAEIAEIRGVSVGTVKAQSGALFKKTGVSSKSELMSVLLDEFLDVSEQVNT
jgi:DNA-binding CsgD family transcriptional regulator